ncbi:transposase [Schnuerera sp. xch1]|uniref:transposase n=1 Tax=Schnuerera sp. xch1 TaxID=2874283 RepID=UPI001CBFB429|nr:transposase [Schnuerera sp. xch1]MBZ2174060.1 transposase [Schnuerera sp. xch1]
MSKKPKYSKEFKLSVIEEYTSGKYSQSDLTAKYIINAGVISSWFIEIKDYDTSLPFIISFSALASL